MLIHLLIIIKNNLRANLLLMAGMFVIATSLWYAVDYVYAVVVNQQKSLGFDWEHVYYVQAAVLPDESVERDTASRSDDEVTAEYLEFYNRLQRHPAVESACYTLMHFHYMWKNGSGTMSYDTLKTNAMYREVTPSYFTVFRVRGADECSPEELSRRASHTNDFVVTENAACQLLNPDLNNVTVKGVELAGRFIHSGVSMREDEPDSVRVAAVCENQKYNEYSNWSRAVYRIIQLGQGDFKISYGSLPYHDIFIRVKADADRPGFVESFRKEMKKQLRVGNLYLADMRPMGYYRNEHLADYRSDLYTYLAIAGFFLANAFLAIQTLLMGEGFLLITIAYIPALVVAYNLGISDLVETWPVEWSFTRFLIGGLVTFLLLLTIAAISIWFPARQAMSIQPAEALHGE